MQSLIYRAGVGAELAERPEPRVAAADDVLIRVVATGICGTDRNIVLGRFPAMDGVILGHEAVGVVECVGASVPAELRSGTRVVIDPTLCCRVCDACRRGTTNLCRNKQGTEVGVDRDGSFAEYIVVPAPFVHALPKAFDLRSAILIEPLTCVLNNLSAVDLGWDDVVAVLGGGPIGTLTALVAQRRAGQAIVFERDPVRAELAARHVADVRLVGDDLPLHLADVGAQLVVDTTGVLVKVGLTAVRPGGAVLIMGYNAEANINLAPLQLLARGVRLVGAGNYRSDLFPVAVGLAQQLGISGLVTHSFGLEQYREALHMVAADRAGPAYYTGMKVVLRSTKNGDWWAEGTSPRGVGTAIS